MAGTAHTGRQSSSLPADSSPSAPLLLSQHASDQAFGSSDLFNTAVFTACSFWNRVLPGLSTCLRDCCPHSPSVFLDRFQIWCCSPDLPQLKSHPGLFFSVTSFSWCCENLLTVCCLFSGCDTQVSCLCLNFSEKSFRTAAHAAPHACFIKLSKADLFFSGLPWKLFCFKISIRVCQRPQGHTWRTAPSYCTIFCISIEQLPLLVRSSQFWAGTTSS